MTPPFRRRGRDARTVAPVSVVRQKRPKRRTGTSTADSIVRPAVEPWLPNLVSWLLFAGLVVILVWSARALLDYGELSSRLSGKSFIERGYIGADPWQSFLDRAGRPRTQQAFVKAQRTGLLPGYDPAVAASWVWIARLEPLLPVDAKIYVNVPDEVLYYYGTTFWFPRDVHVNTRSTIITGHTLRANSAHLDAIQFGHLRQLGYTHVVEAAPAGVRLLSLAGAARGVGP